jgi:diaminohydroxyphosphoribosylaminopyrimidine deaminase/5-amino-6-(5-phosphoribosylamino)uracil reductase
MSTKKDNFTKKDNNFMQLALRLAKARHGLTGNNPSVGCVIVKNDHIISIGQTGYHGRPHAEYNAIKNSNENLKGSKMYITLEPCNHHGQTPPCTNEIIKNNISEIIYSINDIDTKVKGKSFKILKLKKIIVKKGLLKNEMSNFYLPYFLNRRKKIPYVTGKLATTKNNLIYSKNIKKITDKYSDNLTHYLRYKNDSILISYKTLNTDNPKLNCRLQGLHKFSPRRIILDSNLKMKTNTYIYKTANKNNTIIFYKNATKSKIHEFKKKNILLIKSNLMKNGYFDLKSILQKLYYYNCRNLLVEGGNDLSSSFLKNKLFNEFYLFKSQKDLSKKVPYKSFDYLKCLPKKYKNKSKIKTKLGKDSILIYKN